MNAKVEQMLQLSTICQNSYDRTLAKHHGWLIKKAVAIAINFIASRESLMQSINENSSTEDEVYNSIGRLVRAMREVYNRVQAIFERRNLLELP